MSSSTFYPNETPARAFGRGSDWAQRPANIAHYGIVPFRRDANGAIVPGTIIEAPNGEIAWRKARAAAFDHDNVGAIELRDGVLLAQFGEVNLDALNG